MNIDDLLPKNVIGLFDLMKIAEEEIEAAELGLSEEDRLRVHDSFHYLCPMLNFANRRPELYRRHCREIIQRVRYNARDTEIDLGTMAEVLIALSEMSMIAPLGGDAPFLYARLFKKFLPEEEMNFSIMREAYPGSSDELFFRMSAKLAVKRNRREDK